MVRVHLSSPFKSTAVPLLIRDCGIFLTLFDFQPISAVYVVFFTVTDSDNSEERKDAVAWNIVLTVSFFAADKALAESTIHDFYSLLMKKHRKYVLPELLKVLKQTVSLSVPEILYHRRHQLVNDRLIAVLPLLPDCRKKLHYNKKAQAMLATIGVQSSEVSRLLELSKDTLSKNALVVNALFKIKQNRGLVVRISVQYCVSRKIRLTVVP